MNVLCWHVHGSWMTAFVQGAHTYLVPRLPDRCADGRGRAQTWDWPDSVVEVSPAELGDADIDVVVLQRTRELELTSWWTKREPGRQLPAVYVEHNTPRGDAADWRHPLASQWRIPIVHVTDFNAIMWDNGNAPVRVIEHGVVDPGYRYGGERHSLACCINEPVRRWHVAGVDLAVRLGRSVPVELYGMAVKELANCAALAAIHEDLPQSVLHERLGAHRAYLHPYRWTSLGLALIEAMCLGLPVVALAATATPDAVPPDAGFVSNDPDALGRGARWLLAHPLEAAEMGRCGRNHALARFGLARFLSDWDQLLEEVAR